MEKPVMRIRTPEDTEPGRYMLILRSGGPFGGASTTFIVDNLYAHFQGGYAAERDGQVVTRFSKDTSWILVDRSHVQQLTREEAARLEQEDEKAREALTRELYPERFLAGAQQAQKDPTPDEEWVSPGTYR